MQGYFWAETPDRALFVVLMVDGKGYVPGVEGAIDLGTANLLEPLPWPAQPAPPRLNSGTENYGAPAVAAMRGADIIPFVKSALRAC